MAGTTMADRLFEPAMKTPSGIVSQFPTTHSSNQSWFYIAAAISTIVPGTLLLLRLYTKWYIVRKMDLIDCLATMSFLFLVALIVIARLRVAEGAGVHQWNLPMHNYTALCYWLHITQILYAPALVLAKVAILLQYLRVFAPQKVLDPFMWYGARIIIAVAGLFYSITLFITIFACSPREAIWNHFITNFHCIDNEKLILIICLFNILSDTVILILPARAVWNLRISTGHKIKIMLLFAIGLLACIATVMIVVYLLRSIRVADESYNDFWINIWAFVEVSVGVSVVGTFMLPKFLEAKGPKLLGFFSRLARPLTSGRRFGVLRQWKEDKMVASEELALGDKITMVEQPSESDLEASTKHDEDMERYPSYEGVHDC